MGIEILKVCVPTNTMYLKVQVLDVDMPNNRITVAFEMNLTWRDPRLQFNHQKMGDIDIAGKPFGSSNLVPTQNNSDGSEEYAICTPTIMLLNTRNMLTTTRIPWSDAHTTATIGLFVVKVTFAKICNIVVCEGGRPPACHSIHGFLLDVWPRASQEYNILDIQTVLKPEIID